MSRIGNAIYFTGRFIKYVFAFWVLLCLVFLPIFIRSNISFSRIRYDILAFIGTMVFVSLTISFWNRIIWENFIVKPKEERLKFEKQQADMKKQ